MTDIQQGPLQGECHCGQVSLRVPGRPEYLNECNCTLCWKLGTMWGYFPRSQVDISGETQRYVRADAGRPYLGVHFCPQCGATTHWASLADDAPDRMAVNIRLLEPAELAGIEVRYGDRRNFDTVEPRHYYGEPTIFDGLGAAS